MKLSVGYQLAGEDEEPFADIVGEFRSHVASVYFAWAGHASGRSPVGVGAGGVDPDARRRMEADLVALRDLGVGLDLLLNANCYGGRALSRALEDEVTALLAHLADLVGGVDSLTTTSLAVAHMVRGRFPDVEIKASVNMRIGTIQGMAYMADLFDAFCVQREFNRDLAHLRRLKRWADDHGKRLTLLVNSGCLAHCSGQTFHDNLVAHEAEISDTVNIQGWNPSQCWNYFGDRTHWPSLLQNSWIRPEDLHHYEGLFAVAKLATRMHASPRRVVQAYCTGRYRGNLLDLFEPNHTPAIAPYVIDNTRFPDDWFEHTTRCDKRCHACDYCAAVLDRVLVKVE